MITVTESEFTHSAAMRELLFEKRGICGGFLLNEELSDGATEVAQDMDMFIPADRYHCTNCQRKHTTTKTDTKYVCITTQQPLREQPTVQSGWKLSDTPILVRSESENKNDTLLTESLNGFTRSDHPTVSDVYSLSVPREKSDGMITFHPLQHYFITTFTAE